MVCAQEIIRRLASLNRSAFTLRLSAVSTARPSSPTPYGGRWKASLALLAVIALASRLDAEDKSFLWRVQSRTGTLYLLGSIHYLKAGNYPLRRSIQDAFERSQTLVLEIDLQRDATRAQQLIVEQALYQDGANLQEKISPQTYDLAAQRARELGLDLDQMRRFKPWFVALSLLSIKLQRMGFDANLGLDRVLADKAQKSGKTIRGLETPEFQIGLLNQLSPAEQESMLRQTVAELDQLDTNVEQIVQSWNSGNAAALEELLLTGMKQYPGLYEKVVLDRNRRWVEDLAKMLEQGNTTLVVVGAAHLVGRNGLIDLLKQRGYTVEQL